MYAPVQNYNESRSESRSVINKISKNTDITAFYVTYKESTGMIFPVLLLVLVFKTLMF